MARLFISNHGIRACKPHMFPGDRFLGGPHQLRHLERGSVIHVVGELPRPRTDWYTAMHVVNPEFVFHDARHSRGWCEDRTCPFMIEVDDE